MWIFHNDSSLFIENSGVEMQISAQTKLGNGNKTAFARTSQKTVITVTTPILGRDRQNGRRIMAADERR